MRTQNSWTNEEINVVKDHYGKNGAKYCSYYVNHSIGSIQAKARALGIKYNGHGSRFKDISNQRFGRLVAIEVTEKQNINGGNLWKCLCDCGNITHVSVSALNAGTCQSCGCYRLDKITERLYSGGKYITGAEWKSYRYGAKIRNFEFFPNMSQLEAISYVEDIYEGQNKLCKLTKLPIFFNSTVRDGNGKIINGDASIDRIDSTKGYFVGNIQIIHKDVNLMKQAYSLEYYINICNLVSQNHERL